MGFVGEHSLFGGATAAPFLPAELFDAGLLRSAAALLDGFDFVEEKFACEGTILCLVSRGLAFHLNTGWPMKQLNARRGFVYVLPAVSAGANESFFDIRFMDAEGRHARGKRIF
jgi:hypothetical protein